MGWGGRGGGANGAEGYVLHCGAAVAGGGDGLDGHGLVVEGAEFLGHLVVAGGGGG